jgi:hypothetical protein
LPGILDRLTLARMNSPLRAALALLCLTAAVVAAPAKTVSRKVVTID